MEVHGEVRGEVQRNQVEVACDTGVGHLEMGGGRPPWHQVEDQMVAAVVCRPEREEYLTSWVAVAFRTEAVVEACLDAFPSDDLERSIHHLQAFPFPLDWGAYQEVGSFQMEDEEAVVPLGSVA